jgi:small-conductance mechanosensitive channel
LLQLLLGLMAISLASQFSKRLIVGRIADIDTRYRVRKAITLISYVVVFVYTLAIFSDNLQQFTVIFGVVGAGITLALQDIIASVAGWLAISLGRFFDPGDRILIDNTRGDVIDISLLSTTIMECGDWVASDLYNGRIVKIPNNRVFKSSVVNYSRDFPFLWDELVLPIRHGSDRMLTQRILQQAADTIVGDYTTFARRAWEHLFRRYLVESASVDPLITLRVTENWMEYTLRYVVDYKQRRAKASQLFQHIMDAIDRSDGQVAIAARPIHLVNPPPLDVHLLNQSTPIPPSRSQP